MSDKWIMFKNYLHNELGITKEIIQDWIKEAVKEIANEYVEHHLSEFTIERIINKHIENTSSWNKNQLNYDVKQMAAKILADKLEISIKLKEEKNNENINN